MTCRFSPMPPHKRGHHISPAGSSKWDITAAGSVSSSPVPTGAKPTKKSKFDKQFNTATTSDADVLSMFSYCIHNLTLTIGPEKQSKSWTSSVYTHFKPPSISTDDDGEVTYVFVCKK